MSDWELSEGLKLSLIIPVAAFKRIYRLMIDVIASRLQYACSSVYLSALSAVAQ